ncbi:MAG TPA: type II toxin-antitoxin system HicB family antitoxin [Verrucomicrobiota bacterium]|nr:type II toxin-antitoxin system HicB family antitoxin [Verrucomicrobiota bacterium]
MNRYLIVLERTATGFSAYAPDLPGCIATGRTRAETEAAMREAMAFHLESLRDHGEAAPEPASEAAFAEIPA